MKKLLTLLIALIILSNLMPIYAENSVMSKVQVSGSSSLSLKADYATISLGINERNKEITRAQERANATMYNIIETLKTYGIKEEDMHTSNISVYPNYDYSSNYEQISSYVVENTITVQVNDLEDISILLDAAIKAGANQTYGLNFYSSKSEDAYFEALKLAVENGTDKAKVLAESAGKQLGELLLVKEEHVYTDFGYDRMALYSTGEAAGTPVLMKDIIVSANVMLEYQMD